MQELYDEARPKGKIVIGMKNDWKRIFTFESIDNKRLRKVANV